jgi:hypothetical protein
VFAFSKPNLFRLTENFIYRSNNYISTEQNQEEYEHQNRFFEKAWNQNNFWNNQIQKHGSGSSLSDVNKENPERFNHDRIY